MTFYIRGNQFEFDTIQEALDQELSFANFEASCSGNNPIMLPISQLKYRVESGDGEYEFSDPQTADEFAHHYLAEGLPFCRSSFIEEIK